MVMTDDEVKSFVIEIKDGAFVCGEFSDLSLKSLINLFAVQPIGLCDCGLPIYLKKSVNSQN